MASSLLSAETPAGKTAATREATLAATHAATDDDDGLTTSLRCCANDPDFAVICAFLQKFSKDLGLDLPNFKQLQEWLTSTEEVSQMLRDLHIKLLRKTRKTVHEKSWESALSKFCFTYSFQDAWEIERFGYKNASIKVKLRILRELLESQFERNAKFRAKILTFSADSLRSEPIGRDRLGHSYWLTQDDDCNLRIYQEHLDEEIWQVVATNRDEFVNLIRRLRGNEVVLPSSDIGVIDEDTSSSNSCTGAQQKPPPPEERDDSQEDEQNGGQKVPNLRIKLFAEKSVDVGMGEEELAAKEDAKCTQGRTNECGEEEFEEIEDECDEEVEGIEEKEDIVRRTSTNEHFTIEREKQFKGGTTKSANKEKLTADVSSTTMTTKKRLRDEQDNSSFPRDDEQSIIKKSRPLLLDSKRAKKPSKYEENVDEDDYDEMADEEDEEDDEEIEEEDVDSAAAEEGENEEKEVEEYDEDENDEDVVSEVIEDPIIHVHGEGTGKDCEGKNDFFFSELYSVYNSYQDNCIVGEIIEEKVLYVLGVGCGVECMVGNDKNETETTISSALSTSTTCTQEPKAKFFFGEPGCLKLSPMKQSCAKTFSKEQSDEKKNLNPDRNVKEYQLGNFLNVEKQLRSWKNQNDKYESENKDSSNDFEKRNSNGDNSDTCNKEGESVVKEAMEKKEEENIYTELSATMQESDSDLFKKNSKYNEGKKEIILKGEEEGKEGEIFNLETTKCVEQIGSPKSLKCLISEPEVEITKSDGVKTFAKEITEESMKTTATVEEKQLNLSLAKSQTIIVSTKDSALPTVSNRKRRLDEIVKTQTTRLSNSESEVDIHSECPEEFVADIDVDDKLDVGGKRPKMRPKLTNTELRKKVEAQKAANEETTSSSGGEEESRRRRKINLPQKHLDKPIVVISETVEQQKDTVSSPSNICENQLDFAKTEVSKVESGKNCNAMPVKSTYTVKHKPTLAEIIEKKLKKTPEKTVVSCLSTDKEGIEQTVTLQISSLKKSPITKPLKKNLLTQLRQEESDEETIPRKRTINETISSKVTDDCNQILGSVGETEKNEINCISLDRKTIEGQRKRRSSEENIQRVLREEPEAKKEVICETIQENNVIVEAVRKEDPLIIDKSNVDLKIIESDVKIEKGEVLTATFSRRSSRRGGVAVIYTELLQPKRTRAGVKCATKKEEIKDENIGKQRDCETAHGGEDLVKEGSNESLVVANKNVTVNPTNIKTELDAEKKYVDEIDEEDSGVEKNYTGELAKSETETLKANKEDKLKECKENPIVSEISKEITANTLIPSSHTTTVTFSKPITTSGRGRGGRKKREVDTKNIIETTDTEIPVRQSRRIAQQKIREEAERRKLEEIALRTMKQELKKKKKAEKKSNLTAVVPSDASSSDTGEESEIETKKKLRKRKCPGKNGSWSSGSEEQEEPEEDDDEEPAHYETDPGSPLFKSDHEFSPESELEDETQVVPMKRARTARKENASDGNDEDEEEEACQKCGKSDHPEWILLCDSCDKGYHCSCLSPVLFYIPEGDWYCPPCQQDQLILALEGQLKVFDELIQRKKWEEEEEKRVAEEAERENRARLEEENKRKENKKQKYRQKGRRICEEDDTDDSDHVSFDNDDDNEDKSKNSSDSENDSDSENISLLRKTANKRLKSEQKDKSKNRRRAFLRGSRRRRRYVVGDAGLDSGSNNLMESECDSGSGSKSSASSSSTYSDSDNEPIYKLRKRRQINVTYRLNEYDDLINSALKKEMDEAAGAGNLGRGKDISTIIEADKEEKARQKYLEDGEENKEICSLNASLLNVDKKVLNNEEKKSTKGNSEVREDNDEEEDELVKSKSEPKVTLKKKKTRKLTMLDISSEEDDASDEDFKTSSLDEEEEEEDTSISVSTNSDSSLEIYRRRGINNKKQRKAARRAARERRKDRKFVVDGSEDDDEEESLLKSKKKRKEDSDYSESESGEEEVSDLSENVDSADLCEDTTSEESDVAWRPNKRKKQRKSNVIMAHKSPKLQRPHTKKSKHVVYSDDDISETDNEDEDKDDVCIGSGKGSGKQPRSQPLISSSNCSNKSKGKSQVKATTVKRKKKKSSEDEQSFSDSGDSTRRTRGRRYAYMEDFDEDSSDGGIKPGVKRPDTPPEEREKFIQRQEEIKRMLAEKNSEGAKLAATPCLMPIKTGGEKEKRVSAKPGCGDSLSTVPLSVIRQAKVLDIDYLQRKGENVGEIENNVNDVDSEFDDADLPDDLPEDMDEDAIARMVEEEEDFGTAAAARELPAPDEVLRTSALNKSKLKDLDKLSLTTGTSSATSLHTLSASGLQEPIRKRLPMPTMHPPLLRHQYTSHGSMAVGHSDERSVVPTSHLLENALSAPLVHPVHRTYPVQTSHSSLIQRLPHDLQASSAHGLSSPVVGGNQFMSGRLTSSATISAAAVTSKSTDSQSFIVSGSEKEAKPRGRRKKITPLRDSLQKQQAAAAVTAATATPVVAVTTTLTSTPEKLVSSTPPPTTSTSSVIKTTTPPATQLLQLQPSVITRMPNLTHLSAARRAVGTLPPPSSIYSGPDVTQFYGPQGARPTLSGAPRHRVSPQMPPNLLPHNVGLRPSYGMPPPLRGSGSGTSQPPSNSVGNVRVPYGGTSIANGGDHHPSTFATPPSTRHTGPNLNPYRPSVYSHPNFTPRVTPAVSNLRTGMPPPNTDYATGARAYSPFGYYPPPPICTPSPSSHQQTAQPLLQTASHSTSSLPQQPPSQLPSSSSVIVAAPPIASNLSVNSGSLAPPASSPVAPVNHAMVTTISASKSPSPSHTSLIMQSKSGAEPRKKLTNLEAYTAIGIKSPLAIGEESSGLQSPSAIQPDGAEDSSSIPALCGNITTHNNGGEDQASEFSGLVSYFSSQHDDYNT